MDVGPDALMEIIEERTIAVHEQDDSCAERNVLREEIRDHRVDADREDAITEGFRTGAFMFFS